MHANNDITYFVLSIQIIFFPKYHLFFTVSSGQTLLYLEKLSSGSSFIGLPP